MLERIADADIADHFDRCARVDAGQRDRRRVLTGGGSFLLG
jgi:hypothetical protein